MIKGKYIWFKTLDKKGWGLHRRDLTATDTSHPVGVLRKVVAKEGWLFFPDESALFSSDDIAQIGLKMSQLELKDLGYVPH